MYEAWIVVCQKCGKLDFSSPFAKMEMAQEELELRGWYIQWTHEGIFHCNACYSDKSFYLVKD